MNEEKQEEERIQRAMNRKPNRSSMLVKSGNEAPPVSSTPSYSNSKVSTNAKSPTQAQEKPKAVSFQAPAPTSHNSNEIENLQMKKRTVLGTIVSTRRDLDDVRNEIAKLKAKESELVALLEKREQSVQQLTQEIEQLEQKGQAEDSKRKEEEKAKRVKEEIDRRKKEEEEEERKKIEEEEKKILNPQPLYAPRVTSSENILDDGINAEELRLMRAMSRPTKAGGSAMPTRTSGYRPGTSTVKQISEEERRRIAEENKRKEDESRQAQERSLGERIAHLQYPGGVSKKFTSPQVYDFDADIRFCADFTQFEDIPINTQIDNSFTHSVTWQVSPGLHFYVFKINGKAEINKNIPTGLAPNGQLMNKIEC